MTGVDLARQALLLQLGTTLPLVGLIWFVQLVAYPLFAIVGAAEFADYHAAHSRWITWVVGPLMLGELAGVVASLALATLQPSGASASRELAWLGGALLAGIWVVTFFASVPQHATLSRGFDSHAHELLVTTNWLRTLGWTARGALVLWALRGSTT